jgi:dTDP-4-amino-4,6-dideoxygalactose transaminase
VAEGSSYILSDVLAAILDAQLDKLPEIQRRRAAVAAAYRTRLTGWAREHGVHFPPTPDGCQGNDHLFCMLLPDEATRDRCLASLREQGVMAAFHYVPLHSAPHGQRLGQGERELPVTDRIAGTLLRLPLHPLLSERDVDRVVAAVERSLAGAARST